MCAEGPHFLCTVLDGAPGLWVLAALLSLLVATALYTDRRLKAIAMVKTSTQPGHSENGKK